jgi:hypothetical protein
LWTPKLLNSKHFHRGWTRKPHEHKPNSEIGRVRYYSLNTTGTRIWQGLKRGWTLHEISQQLQTEFAVEAERADHSMLELINELCQYELVQVWD